MLARQWVKLLASIDISTRAPWITLNEQHNMACTSTKLNCTGMQATGRGRRRCYSDSTREYLSNNTTVY
jgi:hypothetical protein